MNNWELHHFPDREKAMVYAIGLTLKRVPGASISWGNRNWTKEDFSSLKDFTEIISYGTKKADKKD